MWCRLMRFTRIVPVIALDVLASLHGKTDPGVTEICTLLEETYPIRDVVGHSLDHAEKRSIQDRRWNSHLAANFKKRLKEKLKYTFLGQGPPPGCVESSFSL